MRVMVSGHEYDESVLIMEDFQLFFFFLMCLFTCSVPYLRPWIFSVKFI